MVLLNGIIGFFKKQAFYKRLFFIGFLLFSVSCSTKKEIYSVYQEFPVGNVRASGWLLKMVETEKNGVTGHLDELAPEVGNHIFFNHNVNTEGQFGWWNGEYESNWIDGFARLAASTDDSVLLNKARNWFYKLIEIQKKDSEPYIGIYSPDSEKYPRWSNISGELWPQCRAFLAMEGFYERTRDTLILNSLITAADLTISKLFLDLPEYNRKVNTHSLMMVEPMLKLYRLTGEKKYLDFSLFLYEKLRWFNDLTLSGELFLHGVHVAQNIRIPTLLYEYTGNPVFLQEGLKGIDICADRYMNVAGTLRSDEMVGFAVPDRGSEFCTTVEWFISSIQTARISGKMKYADIAERCYFNAAQGARLPDGSGIQYSSFPNQLIVREQGNDEWKGQPLYGPTHNPLCCNSMQGRLLPAYLNNMWQKMSSEGLLALLYGPSVLNAEIKNKNITIIQETEYPYDEKILFTIKTSEPVRFPLGFRVPSWCKSIAIKVNGKPAQFNTDNSVATISAEWKNNDQIELDLPMEPRFEFKYEWASVLMGPVVYALPVPYKQVTAQQVAPGYAFYRYFPEENFKWNQFLMFKQVPADSAFIVSKSKADPEEFPWVSVKTTIKTKAQPSNDHWRLGMQWYTRDSLQPPAPPFAILAYQIDKRLSDYITLVPYGITRLRIAYFPYAVNVKEE
ncbi:MAG: beta-L-arabinofuranosidase domain-containing protein [Bacteroidales bacterium]